MYQKIKKIDISLLHQNQYINAKVILNEMYDEFELIKFIVKNKNEDTHQMNEFIDDKEDNTLTTSNLEVFENYIEFK